MLIPLIGHDLEVIEPAARDISGQHLDQPRVRRAARSSRVPAHPLSPDPLADFAATRAIMEIAG